MLAQFKPVRVQVGWRVLAGFWREKAGAGRVPSFISACAAANARKGYFRALIPWREGALGAYPHNSDAPSPPVPFFLAPPEGAGGTPGWAPQNLFLETNT
jgi:hypothetical protein